MRLTNLFWGGFLIVIGGLLLANSLGLVAISLWGIFWPLMVISLGIWVLLGYYIRDESEQGEEAVIPLGDIGTAKLILHHGAGRLDIRSGTNSTELVSGTFVGGLRFNVNQKQDHSEVIMRIRDIGFPMFVPWVPGASQNPKWDVNLNPEIPLSLVLKTGASNSFLDLTHLQVTELRVETGVSSTEIYLPQNVSYTKVVIKGGLASAGIHIPEKVAARIKISGGLMGARVDQNKFPKSGRFYQSPGYEDAPNKAEIWIQDGIGSVNVT